jgi:hypothetical protein
VPRFFLLALPIKEHNMLLPRPSSGLLASTILLAAVLGSPPLLATEDAFWPQFHGPERDNRSTDTGLLKRWPEGGPKLLWKTRGIGHGFANVSMADGRIYTAGSIDANTVITAMDMDGQILWQVANGKAWEEPVSGARGTPTIDGRRLYHEGPYGDVVCLDAKTGKRIWGLNILDKFHGKNIRWALSESLLIDGEHVICCPGGQETAMVALDKNTGETVWKSPSAGDRAGYGSPTLAEYRGLRMILTMTSKALIGVDADTGDLLWRHEHITRYDENISTPIFHDGHIFVSTPFEAGSELVKVNVDGRKVSVDRVWQTDELDNQHGGTVRVDGYVYGACRAQNNAKWVCLDWKTGRKMYAERGVGRGSLTYADGMLYTLSERARMGLVKATPNGHEVVSQFPLPPGGEGLSWAHPVVCGGRLYIRHSDFLYVYDVRAN